MRRLLRRTHALVALACASGIVLAACPGGGNRDQQGGESAAVKDTSQPQPNLPSSGGTAADSARGGDTSRAAPGTVRDSAQPQPRLPSGAGTKSGGGTSGAAKATPQESDSARIRRLEAEARALAKADGCTESDQCRTAPVGNRPCGGPRTHIPYCARTTDSAALFRKLEQLAEAERDYNAKRGIGSTCDYRTAPPVEAASGRCHLRTAQPGTRRAPTP